MGHLAALPWPLSSLVPVAMAAAEVLLLVARDICSLLGVSRWLPGAKQAASILRSCSSALLISSEAGTAGASSACNVGLRPTVAVAPQELKLCCPGGGILFFWQLGAAKRLAEVSDLGTAHFVGYSAGALVSVLAACGVDPQQAVEGAHALALEAGAFSRPLGLCGIWGGLVRQWLDSLLPPDAPQRCSGRVHIVTTHIPSMRPRVLSHFSSREQLIDCAMASAHVPWFLDWKPWATLQLPRAGEELPRPAEVLLRDGGGQPGASGVAAVPASSASMPILNGAGSTSGDTSSTRGSSSSAAAAGAAASSYGQPQPPLQQERFVDGHLSMLLSGRSAVSQLVGWQPGEFLNVDHFADDSRGLPVWEFLRLTDLRTVLKLMDHGYGYATRTWVKVE